jgi:hypothetical protein
MVPFRSLVQAKGGVIVWLPASQQVNAWVNNNVLGVTIGKREARINSEVYLLPAAAVLRDARTMVPLRFVVKGMNLSMNCDTAKSDITLTSKVAK